MNIAIIGWYGTETIGDRGILAGLLGSLIDAFGQCKVAIGSLHPFFTQRTVNEDYAFWKTLTGYEIEVIIFDSTDAKTLRKEIDKADLVAMGGGPLMHISELYMIEYAFAYAKKMNKQTAILGCGIGPITNAKFYKTIINIIRWSDLTILRDKKSLDQLRRVADIKSMKIEQEISVSLDPAAVACLGFLKMTGPLKSIDKDKICINLRSFPKEYSSSVDVKRTNEQLTRFVECIAKQNPDKQILLVPMHYFHIGDDDRIILNEIAMDLKMDNLIVQNKNLSLFETMNVFAGASKNVGMRFHSVVMQTLVSGNNYILDYTDPAIGKIFGFLSEIDEDGFYRSRYRNLQENTNYFIDTEDISGTFVPDLDMLSVILGVYAEKLKCLVA